MKETKRILLVDDDADDQEFFIEAISRIENATLFEVANNGKEALQKLEDTNHLPDIIFLDINMPVMNGIECLHAIINNPLTKNIPVVILSSATPQKDLARKIGAKAFIKKSADGKTLRREVGLMIDLDFILNFEIANQTFKNGRAVS